MKDRTSSVSGFIGIVLSTLFFAQCADSETAQSDHDRFTGRWSLVEIQKQDTVSSEWSESDRHAGLQGFIIYDGQGGMGVHQVPADYDQYEFEGNKRTDSLTHNDLEHLAQNFVYFAHYKVLEDEKVVEHHIQSASDPRSFGTVAKRRYAFSGDTLTLSPLTRPGRSPYRIIWVKTDISQ